MKKPMAFVFLISIFLLTMLGCSTANAVQKPNIMVAVTEPALGRTQNKTDQTYQIPPTEPSATVPSLPDELMEIQSNALQTPIPTIEQNQMLSKEQAQKIALEYLGLTAEQVTRMRAEFDIDDGIPQFDVEFRQGKWEFEFEIHAENGNILSYEKDYD